MVSRVLVTCMLTACLFGAASTIAQAQIVPPPPSLPPSAFEEPPIKPWAGSLGAGLAMTRGNTDTSSVNVSFELTHDRQQRLIFKTTGLLIQSVTNDTLTSDRGVADVRLDYRLTYKFTAFSRVNYLRDSFQKIDYLVSPTLGLGYAFVDTVPTKFSIDVSLGTVFERNTGVPLRTSPAFAVGERFAQQITDSARITQQAGALWKIDDFGDGLYTVGAAIAANISSRAELKAEVLDGFKTELTAPAVDNNNVSLLMSVVFKF
jgi:putative salt-induced outer membrane protein YdiY